LFNFGCVVANLRELDRCVMPYQDADDDNADYVFWASVETMLLDKDKTFMTPLVSWRGPVMNVGTIVCAHCLRGGENRPSI